MTALSPDTVDWIYDYMNDCHDVDDPDVPLSVAAELAPYRPREPVVLYRGLAHYVPTGSYTTTSRATFTSWSQDPYVAAGYAEEGILMMARIPAESILVDVEKLRQLALIYVPADEREMIVYPGSYEVVLLDPADYE